MSKTLIAVVTCHQFRDRADAQRATWVPLVTDADVRFFVGFEHKAQRPDEVVLQTWDCYERLPHKVQAMCRWALANNYSQLFKCDDDVYIWPSRLLAAAPKTLDYVGRVNDLSRTRFCSGFGYWLSRRAIEIIANAATPDDYAEDRWVGKTLIQAGIRPANDSRYVYANTKKRLPVLGSDVVALAELSPERMKELHADKTRH